jgi:type IV fimbrial biogenesis protein FimT
MAEIQAFSRRTGTRVDNNMSKTEEKMAHSSIPFVGENHPFVRHTRPFVGPFVGPNEPLVFGASEPCIRAPGPAGRSAGMTLIELMVGVVIVAILVSLGAPQWTKFVQNNRLTATANDFVAAINLARGEAVKRGVTVVLCRSNNLQANPPTCGGTANNWSTGWLLYSLEGDVNEKNYDKDIHVLVKKGYATPEGIKITSDSEGNQWLAFNPDGSLREDAEAAYAICDERGAQFGRLVVISLTGRASIENTDPGNAAKDCTPT